MSITMAPIEYVMPNDTYDAYANLQVGSNGDTDGDPTSSIGDIYGEENWAFNPWDSDVSSGFDTSNVPIQFDVKSDGTEDLVVGSSDPVTYQTSPIGCISSVVLEADVQTNAEASWSNVTVEFLRSGSVVETDNPTSAPDVNTIGSSSSTMEDQQMTITPTATNCDETIVTGTMRLRSPGISYPSSTAMFCNIFVTGTH
jgi:hypothetical protein